MLSLILALSVLGGMSYLYAAHRPPPLDPKTLCRTDAKLPGHTVILIDSSDPLPPLEADRVRALAAAERARLPRFDKLTLLQLNPQKPFEPKVVFSKCTPGSGVNFNPWVENGEQIKKRFNEAIEKPLARRLNRAVKGKGAVRSPVLQTLAAISRRYDFTAAIERRRLIVVSDFLQHDPKGYTQYEVTPSNWNDLKATPFGSQIRARFSNVVILAEYVPRPEDAIFQTEKHRRFWRDYFQQTGAAQIIFLDEHPEAGL